MASKIMRLLLLLTCVANPEVLGDIVMRPSCANGWFYHRSNCYGYFWKLRNWTDAEVRNSPPAGLASLERGASLGPYLIWSGSQGPSVALSGEAARLEKWREEGCVPNSCRVVSSDEVGATRSDVRMN
ncbi:regenerating islet-derived protein 4 isoform 2 precursor, partial [Daubentonia madagascariensis]